MRSVPAGSRDCSLLARLVFFWSFCCTGVKTTSCVPVPAGVVVVDVDALALTDAVADFVVLVDAVSVRAAFGPLVVDASLVVFAAGAAGFVDLPCDTVFTLPPDLT